MSVDYNLLANQYKNYRKPDPRISERIQVHTRGAQRVLNVGAGMGAYEPEGCEVVAIEPSHEMINKRKGSAVTLIQGFAENLPFKDNDFDISMAILTIHHWSNIELGLQEMRRVTKNKVILLTGLGMEMTSG